MTEQTNPVSPEDAEATAFAEIVRQREAALTDGAEEPAQPAAPDAGAATDDAAAVAQPPQGDQPTDTVPAPTEPAKPVAEDVDTIKRRFGGQVSAMQRTINELQRQLAAKSTAPAAPAPQTQPRDGAPSDLDRLREEYPEVAGPILARLEQMDAAMQGILATEASRAQAVQQASEAELLSRHPDFYTTLSTRAAEFNAWVETEAPVKFARIVESNRKAITDPAGAAEVFEAFKAHIGLGNPAPNPPATPAPNPQADLRARQLRATSVPRTAQRTAPAPGVPDGADEEAHFNWLVKQRAAQ